MKSIHQLLIGTGMAVGLCANGCEPRPKDYTKLCADQLDRVRLYVDAHGTASVSEPIILEHKGQFALDYNKPVEHYVNAARTGVAGVSRAVDMEAHDRSRAVQFGADLNQILAQMLVPGGATAQEALAAVAGTPPAAPAPTVALPEAEERLARSALPGAGLSPALDLGKLPEATTERQALLIGLNDKLTELAMRQILGPTELHPNMRAYLLVFEVSCHPGWKTRYGFCADINITTGYARFDEKEQWADESLFTPGMIDQPSVVALFPSIEAQTLDLRSSLRRQATQANSFATALRALGAELQSKSLEDYAKRIEGDSATRTVMPLISSYSRQGSFGYQIRPQFIGQLEPGNVDIQAGGELLPTSFPAIALLLCDTAEMELHGDAGGIYLSLRSSIRWMPLNGGQGVSEAQRIQAAQSFGRAAEYLDCLAMSKCKRSRSDFRFDKYEKMIECEGRAAEKENHGQSAKQSKPGGSAASPAAPGQATTNPPPPHTPKTGSQATSNEPSSSSKPDKPRRKPRRDDFYDRYGYYADYTNAAAEELERRLFLYESSVIGLTSYRRIPYAVKSGVKDPPLGTPAVTAVYPSTVWLDAPTHLIVVGENFANAAKRPVVKQLTIGGVPCAVTVINSKVLVAVAPANAFGDAPANRNLALVTDENAAVYAPQLAFARLYQEDAQVGPVIEIERDGQGRPTVIYIRTLPGKTAQASELQLLNAIQEMLKHEGVLDQVRIEVEAAGNVSKTTPERRE